MSSPLRLHHQFHPALKGLGKWGRPELVETLAHLMGGIFMSRDVRLSRIAENASVVILGNREFGQPEMIKILRSYEWDFCLRIKRQYQVYASAFGMWLYRSELAPRPGHQRFLSDLPLTRSKCVQGVHFALACDPDSDDPWLIATRRLPTKRVLREDARRFAGASSLAFKASFGFDTGTLSLLFHLFYSNPANNLKCTLLYNFKKTHHHTTP